MLDEQYVKLRPLGHQRHDARDSSSGTRALQRELEGEAADAACRSFNDYQAFLVELSGAWNRLAAEAERVAAAHFNVLGAHTPIAEEYTALEARLLPAAIASGGAARVIH